MNLTSKQFKALQRKKKKYLEYKLAALNLSKITFPLTKQQKLLILEIIQYKQNFNDKINFASFNNYCKFNKNKNVYKVPNSQTNKYLGFAKQLLIKRIQDINKTKQKKQLNNTITPYQINTMPPLIN